MWLIPVPESQRQLQEARICRQAGFAFGRRHLRGARRGNPSLGQSHAEARLLTMGEWSLADNTKANPFAFPHKLAKQ
jgi:hypothetical protein